MVHPRLMSDSRSVSFDGRILYITEDAQLVVSQLDPAKAVDLPFEADSAASRQYLHRRNHAGLGLLLLRRDARSLLPRRPAGRPREARRGEGRRVRGHRERDLQGLWIVARDGALQRARGGRAPRRREEHREDLSAERPEHRPAHQYGLRPHPAHRARGGHPDERVHEGARSHQRGGRRTRGPLRVQQGSPRGAGRAPRADDGCASHDPLREDPSRATPSSTPSRARSAPSR